MSVAGLPEDPSFDDVRGRLAAIVDSAEDGIVSKTLDGVITSWNRGAERIFGWTAAEAVGRNIKLIIPPELHAEEDDVLRRLRRGERIEHFETVRVTRDGERRDVSLTISPVRDRTGRIIGASKIARDVTERRRLAEDRTRLAAIIDSSDDAIVSKTLDGVITSWNRGAERIFGWTAAEAVGRHITLIIPRERHAEEVEVLARIRRGESVDHFETIRVAKHGELLNISLTVSPVKDAYGRIVGASTIARDVTERRRLEDERDRLLAREQQARQEAETSNRMKDQLLAIVSHELRTPLNSILGWARMLQTNGLDEAAQRHAVDVIVRNASTQAQLVEDLLDLSRIVTGGLPIRLQPCDLTSLVDEALDAVRPAADAKGLTLVTALAQDVGPILGAPDRLRQVIWNLAMNAVKFTPAGGRIEVHVTRQGQDAQVVVTDNGVGIHPDVLPHIFEPFRQEDSSNTRAHAGLGLGLALVKHLVELHGGQVRAQSAGKGHGATLTVMIPLARLSAASGHNDRGVNESQRRALGNAAGERAEPSSNPSGGD